MKFWTTEQRGAVGIATYSNPPRNYLVKPAIDEFEQLIEQWRDPSIRAVVIQSRPEDAGFMTHYSVDELYELISDPATSRYSAAIVRRYKAIFDRLQALPKVVIAALNGDTMGAGSSSPSPATCGSARRATSGTATPSCASASFPGPAEHSG